MHKYLEKGHTQNEMTQYMQQFQQVVDLFTFLPLQIGRPLWEVQDQDATIWASQGENLSLL